MSEQQQAQVNDEHGANIVTPAPLEDGAYSPARALGHIAARLDGSDLVPERNLYTLANSGTLCFPVVLPDGRRMKIAILDDDGQPIRS